MSTFTQTNTSSIRLTNFFPNPVSPTKFSELLKYRTLILRLVLFGNVVAKYLAEIPLPILNKPANELLNLSTPSKSKRNPTQSKDPKPYAGAGAISAQLGCPNLLKKAVTFIIVFNLLAQLHCCTASTDSDREVRYSN